MLRSGDATAIQKMFNRLSKEAEAVIKGCIRLTYYMKGAVQYEDMLCRSFIERRLIDEFVEERMEELKKIMKSMPAAGLSLM